MFPRLFFLACLSVQCLFAEPLVTYEFSGGRFGDNLISYLHAKWISYKYNIALLYKPFDYSSELVLSDRERHFQTQHTYSRAIKLTNRQRLPSDFPKNYPFIFVVPYFAEDPSDRWLNPNGYRFDTDWKDPEFRKVAREMLAPKNPIQIKKPPVDTVNIALHVREGGGFDTDHTRLWDPLKMPPLHFYIQAFQKAIESFKERPIYCYLFTDALDPSQLAAEFGKVVPQGMDVQIDCRRENNHFSSNVLEDFFSLFNFDVLIHPQSNFSIVPARLNDYAILSSPYNFIREDGKITVTEITFEVNETLYQKVLQRTGGI